MRAIEIDLESRRGNLHIARKIRDDDMEHRVPELVEFATTVVTLLSGDIIACGTNHEGLGALQDGETVEVEIQGIGTHEGNKLHFEFFLTVSRYRTEKGATRVVQSVVWCTLMKRPSAREDLPAWPRSPRRPTYISSKNFFRIDWKRS